MYMYHNFHQQNISYSIIKSLKYNRTQVGYWNTASTSWIDTLRRNDKEIYRTLFFPSDSGTFYGSLLNFYVKGRYSIFFILLISSFLARKFLGGGKNAMQ